MKRIIILILLILSMAALNCTDKEVDTNKSSPVIVKTFNGRGIVKKIDKTKKSITIDHEEIKGLMEAMTMDFHVKDGSLLDSLKEGDKIEFTLQNEANVEFISAIKKL